MKRFTRRRKGDIFLKTLILMLTILAFEGVFSSTILFAGEKYPTKPIELFIPFSAGGGTDLLGRFFAKYACKYFEQPIVVINKPGASGAIAASQIAKSPADGHKLLILSVSFHLAVSKMQKLPFSPSIIMPIANFSEEIQGCLVKGDSPWKNFNDLLDFGRQNPGKLTWSNGGIGIPPHIAMEIALRKAGVKGASVPLKGTPESLIAVMGGHVKAGSMVYTPIKDQVAAGNVRYLVLWREKRLEELPNIPTATELGFSAAAKYRPFFGLYAHKDTPDDIIQTIWDVCQKVQRSREFMNDLNRIGAVPQFMAAKELKEFILEGESEVTPILKELGVYVDK